MGVRAIRRRSSALVLIGAVVGTMLVGAPPAGAAEEPLVVDDPGDEIDANPGDGECATDSGVCTLRAATMEANAVLDVDTIEFHEDLAGTTILLENTSGESDDEFGDLDLTEGVVLRGPPEGVTIDASRLEQEGQSERVLQVNLSGAATPEVAIANLTFTEGWDTGFAGGGGIRFGNTADGRLLLQDVTITGNRAQGQGGGVYLLDGTLIAQRTVIDGNEAGSQGGGIYVFDGVLDLRDSTIARNTGPEAGGGIYTSFFDGLSLTRTDIVGNDTDGEGGGIYLEHDAPVESVPEVATHDDPVTITGGRIADNRAESEGGGMFIAGLDVLTLTDVNVDDNTAEFGEGGGIHVADGGTLSLIRGTVSRNTAKPTGGGIHTANEAIELNINGTSLVGNTAYFASEFGGGDGGAIFAGGLTHLDIRNATFDGNRAGRLDPEDPNPFLPMMGSGGAIYLDTLFLTETEPASAAIRASRFRANTAHAGGGALATAADNTLTVAGTTFVDNVAGVDPNAPAGPLVTSGSGGAVHLGVGTTGTLSAVASPLTLTRFVGNRAGGAGGAIHSEAADLTSRDVRYDSNVAGTAGGAVRVFGPDGGEVVRATFTRGRFLSNEAEDRGGAIAAETQQPITDLTLTNVLLDSNEAGAGGAVHAGEGVRTTLIGGTVRRNTATTGAGGGLFSRDRLDVTNALVEFNTARTSGGGIATSSPLFVTTSTIADNDAVNGGGLVVTAGSAFITRSTFARNDASSSGGGIYIAGQGYAAIELSTLTANDGNRGAAIRTFGGLDLVRTTITFNTSPPNGASLIVSDGRTTLDHTLIACQQEDACIFSEGATVVSLGNNMTDDPDCLVPGGENDRVVLHELIGLNGLQDNGGPTDTHSVRPESLAIDHGARRCPRSPISEAILTVDQRGFPGLVDGDGNGTARCDAGSYEYAQGVLITRSETADEAGPVDGFVELRRSGDLTAPLTVRYEVGGSATPGADYERLSGSVRFPAGANVVRIRVRPVADDLLEATETVTVALVHSSAYSLGLRTFATVPILDAAGAVTIRATDPIASEVGPDAGTFTVRRTGSLDSALEVFLEFGGSALQGTDYPLTPTSVVVPAGSSSVELTITPLDDDVADPGETVVATIEEHPDYRVGAPRAAQITIGEASAGLVRYEGEDRKETAVEVSRATWPDGGAAAVVLARADLYPDALAGGPFATLVDAPMLLTDTAELDPLVAAEIERLGVSRVYLLGQTAALSEDVETTLRELGLEVERIGGADRFETAALIAARVVGNGTLVYITEGLDLDLARGWPDAVSVAPLAAYEGRPILLVTTEEVPEHTFTALSSLGFTQARIIGGPAAVSEDVEDVLEGLALEVERYAGRDRYETSRAVVDLELAVGMDPRRLWLATGAKFPDALVAGPAVAAERGVLLLTPQDDLERAPTTRDFIADLDPSGLLIRLVGGPAAISEAVEQQIRALVGL